MKKPNFLKMLLYYLWLCFTVPIYAIFVPNRKGPFCWKPWERVGMFFLFLPFWWILGPLYAIQDYKRDKKIYENEVNHE